MISSSLGQRTNRLPCLLTASFDSLDNLDAGEAVNTILLFLRSCFAGEEVFGMPLDPKFYADVPNKVRTSSFPCY